MKLRQQRGKTGEEAAVRHLEAAGYRIVERNWRAGRGLRGEVDCIAYQGHTLCFIEVKARSSWEHGAPQEAVTSAKRRQLSHLANAYVSWKRLAEVPCRFDVVEVFLPADASPPRVALRRNAFEYQGFEYAAVAARGRRPRGARVL